MSAGELEYDKFRKPRTSGVWQSILSQGVIPGYFRGSIQVYKLIFHDIKINLLEKSINNWDEGERISSFLKSPIFLPSGAF